jgi:hypothetical protein
MADPLMTCVRERTAVFKVGVSDRAALAALPH